MAARSGIGVQVGEDLAEKVRSAKLTVCQDGDCRQVSVQLLPSTTSIDKGCDGGVCSAEASPTGERHGFAYLPDLSTEKARVHVVLRGSGDATVLHRRVTIDPELVYPNGPDCGGEAPQAQLSITRTDDGVRVTSTSGRS